MPKRLLNSLWRRGPRSKKSKVCKGPHCGKITVANSDYVYVNGKWKYIAKNLAKGTSCSVLREQSIAVAKTS